MATFVKHISHPGEYLAKRSDGKGRIKFKITPERQRRWVDNFHRMKKAGHKIPLPWEHDAQAKPTDTDPSSYRNAGWLKDLWIDKSGKLIGIVDIPLEEDIKKLGNTVCEVSPHVEPSWTDGNDQEWKDAILHLALVDHPVIPGQDNFEPETKEAGGMNFNLNDRVGAYFADDDKGSSHDNEDGNASSSMIEKLAMLKKLLAEKKGIDLPGDASDPESFLDQLIGALAGGDKEKTTETEEEALKTAPAGAQAESAPVAMSLADAVKTNPAIKAMADQMNDTAKKGYKSRIEALINDGRIPAAHAEETILPHLQGFQLSLGTDGKPQPHLLDNILSTLEALPPNTLLQPAHESGSQLSISDGKIVEEKRPDAVPHAPQAFGKGAAITADEVNRVVKSQLENYGQ